MTQTIEFNCKYENAGKRCTGKVVYEPEEIHVLAYLTRMTDLKSTAPHVSGKTERIMADSTSTTPYASGEMESMKIKCDKGHWGYYKIVKFACQNDKCNLVVVGTGEAPPVYQEERRRVINKKVKLTCDNQTPHTYVYHVQ
jgi:hypothetical protein